MVELIFWHKAALGRVKVRSERKIYEGGVHVDTVPEIVAEAGIAGDEYPYEGPDGLMHTGADIRGHFIDVDEQAERKGWSDQEKSQVVKVLTNLSRREPEMVKLWEVPKAKAPWPTYDETHHNQIPVLAEQLGLVGEALAYEREREKPRESVIGKLEEMLHAEPEELTAA